MAYSDAERTEALVKLAVNRYNYKLTAEQTGVTVRTLRNWENNYPKKTVPLLLNRAIERLLMVIPEKWDGNEWAIALGILMDKWLLLQGEPTSRAESVFKTIEEMSDSERDAVITEAERILAEATSSGASDSNGETVTQTT